MKFENPKLIYDDKNQKNELSGRGKGCMDGSMKTRSWLGEMVFILAGELVTQAYLFMEIH